MYSPTTKKMQICRDHLFAGITISPMVRRYSTNSYIPRLAL